MKYDMKKYYLFILLFVSVNSFGQQFLWTTNKNGLFPNSDIKVISKDEVLSKLKFYYETYDVYYDGTGFTKEGFFEKFESSNSFRTTNKNNWEQFKKSVSETNELTISCIKSNEGTGSSIMILIVNKNNFDSIIFSNTHEEGYINTLGPIYGFPKFEKFYKSLIEN
jgi:hypothetical protein